MTINQWQIQERGPVGQATPPPRYFTQTEAKRAKRFFFAVYPPSPPPLSQGLDLALLLAD